jgi:alkylation response protein AidB-like acyl-CoA dehydrogenase
MPNYVPPLRDYRFILHEVLKIQDETAIEGYGELTDDFTGAVLEEAGKIASEVLAPINRTGDMQGCTLEGGVVRTPDGFREAFALLRDGGWPSMECDPAYGGQGMPAMLNLAVGTMQSAANMAFMMYSGLTHGAYSAIHRHGTEALKATYLPKLVSGDWTGTMNLTEAHCGTDLGMLRTRAEPQGDGSYRITGSKIFISAGEHDLAENIIHLVLARITGAPEGIKGISLFVVPKFLVNRDGSPGERNGVVCSKVEEKMGIHGNSTCSMEYDSAAGWLLGNEHKGLRAMFTMMNEARMGVAMQGLAVASGAYQAAAAYAKERLQGRAVTGAVNPTGPADPLIVHPDVRRLLLDQKSFVDGGRTFLSWVAMLADAETRHADPEMREKAADMASLLTPVIKGFLTEEGYRLAGQAQQVFGGHGYIEETGMSQFVRDARIAMIYEGATGVQALDLVGRKLPQKMGKPIMTFFEYVKGYIKANEDDLTLEKQFLEPLKKASKNLQSAAVFFMQAGMKNPNAALAGSVDFLHLFGLVCMGLSWTKMAKAASVALQEGTGDPEYYNAKLATGRYYMSRVLPETALRLARIETGAEPVMDLAAEAF